MRMIEYLSNEIKRANLSSLNSFFKSLDIVGDAV